jgi:hypothetical protein
MRPIDFDGTNRVLRKPPGWTEEQCVDLHVRAERGTCSSRWVPTPEELAVLQRGGAIELTVAGDTHPPVALSVVTL